MHGVWLANTLAIAPDSTRLTIHRSLDGLKWTGPIDAARAPAADIAYDKNWLACDDGAASPLRGRCYLAYTLVGEQEGEDDVAVQYSNDGGVDLADRGEGSHPGDRRDPRRPAERDAHTLLLVSSYPGHGRRALDGRRRNAWALR